MLNKVENGGRSQVIYSVPPVVRAIKVLRYIAAGHSVANQTQSARAIGVNRTTLLRLLHTLEAERLIEHVAETGGYVLGTGIVELATRKISSLDVAQVASPVLERLARRVGLSCHLGVLDGREVLYVVRHTPNVPLVSNVTVGTRLPAHASTMGRIILAHMPWSEVEALYRRHQLFAVTPRTPKTMAQLARQLAAARKAGIADSRSNYEIGIDAIAAAIFDHNGRVVAAINVSGPERAFQTSKARRREIAAALVEAAGEICRQMGHSAGPRRPAGRPVQHSKRHGSSHGSRTE